ncbi:uroporphyrinogen-III synthase [Acinetobacter oleivorans]|uniref:uroporphyrinogen-III synthase n=1 Tax=Acinetobacter oleivorans TaxID=1148157 RepID=UPI000E9871EC|nr:uroporphyrinogen-III synthase [Acinetobacter oleivorans]MBE2173977.1 uroporphyrinogen-III synthase [Acinetobacter oleivorans]MDY7373869.1 uroporphyrinogen-III synthase [Acinetobacter oleivorans]HBU87813.1 uroporphyrinogen-III synthase [Acinetobacter sp.]
MLFINTRPDSRAAELTDALQNEGYQVESLSLLELVAKPFSEHLLQLYQQLVKAQAIVVVSPTAVDVGMQYLMQSGLKLDDLTHIQWIAVGQATANRLHEYGVDAHIPDVETSEGMLNLPILHNMKQAGSVAFWRGEGGRQFMMDTLQQQGIQILNFVLYHRQCPQDSYSTFKHLTQNSNYNLEKWLVLITSEASWKYWLELCSKNNVQPDCVYLVLGPRLFQIVKEYRDQQQAHFHIIQLENLSPSGMIHHIQAL